MQDKDTTKDGNRTRSIVQQAKRTRSDIDSLPENKPRRREHETNKNDQLIERFNGYSAADPNVECVSVRCNRDPDNGVHHD